MKFELGKFWAGTEEALAQYLINTAVTLKHGYQGQNPNQGQGEQEKQSRLVSVSGSVGVISIRGSLTNRDSGYGSYETTYPEIRDAVIQLANDPAVKAVVLDINSGGGSVTGVSDTGKLIRALDGLKPVYAYTDGMMASAAYWLGSSARKVYASQMAEVGSVGVITTHMAMHRMYQEIGIDPTVLRAGEFKALGHPMEPLSDKAKAVIQDQLDQMYGMFAGYVADRRGMSLELFNKSAGEGRTFIGQKGVDAGLLDGVTTFDALVSRLESDNAQPSSVGVAPGQRSNFRAGGIASCENLLQSGPNSSTPGFQEGQQMPNKIALTEQQLAALAEGAAMTMAALPVVTTQDAAAPQAPETKADAPEQGSTEASVQSAEPKAEGSIVALLQSQLAAAQAQVVDLTVELRSTKSELDGSKAANLLLRPIVQASVDRMKVALGMPAGVAASSDQDLLAEHANLRASFEAKFKSGGVAAVSASAEPEGAGQQPDPARQARIQATRLK